MTTSSSERPHCTRISPSAVIDDRLQGDGLEWALDHLKLCDVCRERVEDFREMALRVECLPHATVGPAALAEAYAWSVPESLRTEGPGMNSPDHMPAVRDDVPVHSFVDVTSESPKAAPRRLPDLRPEVKPASIPSAAFGGEKTAPAAPAPSRQPFRAAAPIAPPAKDPPDLTRRPPRQEPEPGLPLVARGAPPPPTREVTLDSRHEPQFHSEEPPMLQKRELDNGPTGTEVVTSPPRARDFDIMRVVVGFGAAACVLLAGALYGGAGMGRVLNLKASGSTSPATQNPRTSVSPTLDISPAPVANQPPPPAVASPTASVPVVATVGNGVSGENVWRIRPGTAVPGFTRLAFDLTGQGLPTMVITRPDDLHLVVTFRGTGGADVPVQGIQSYHVTGVEPAIQRGPDLQITIDLARPVRPVVFTLPAEAGKSPRLVLDLYTS